MAEQMRQERRGWFSRNRGTDEGQRRGVFGSARWSSGDAVAAKGGAVWGPFVGLWPTGTPRDPTFEPMTYEGDGHLLMVAPSRSGKARDVLVRSLLTNADSALVLDIKGELAAVTARARREMRHDVFCLNPYGMHVGPPWNLPQHGFNPLMALDPSSANFTAQEESLAGALIQHDSNESAHWADSARSVVVGLAEYEVLSARGQGRMPSLANVRGYLSMGEEDFGACVAGMVANAKSDGVRDRLAAFEKMTNELRAVRSTAKAQTTWLADPAMRKAVERHDFDFADLKSKPMTVYVILPSHLISKGMTYSRYLRLILQSALEAMTMTPRKSERPVWFLVDETYSLGPLPILERMMSEGAGYGIQLQPIIQNLGQLKELYRSNYESFIANAAVQQWFAPRDMTTADYVSKMLGQYTANTQTISARNEVSIGETGRPLLRPEEVMQLTEYEQIVFLRGCPNPLKLYRSPYFKKTWGLEGKYDPNPYHIG